ncbi:MAG: hypothetical protein ACQESP_02565 [Candidatus Muiribacteriota bacterium]
MKKSITVFTIVISVIFWMTIPVNSEILTNELSYRQHFAADIVAMDEDFLGEYIDILEEDELMYFFQLAIEMAVEVAGETKYIESEDEALIYIVENVDGENGVKQRIFNLIEKYLNDEYEPDFNRVFEKRNSRNKADFNIVEFSEQVERIKLNIEKIKMQKSVFYN